MWQPIETAPKDGGIDAQRVLLLFANGDVSVAYWDLYYAEGGRGYQGCDAWIEPVSGELLANQYNEPTHWQPLPPPPQPPAHCQPDADDDNGAQHEQRAGGEVQP